MATFSEERAPSRPFGRWDLSAMVEATRKPCGVQAVRKDPRLIETSVRFIIARFVQLDPFSEVDHRGNFASAVVALNELDASDHPLS